MNWKIWLIIMALQTNLTVVDGDPAFLRVDTRRPAHQLEPGVAADALNKRSEDGRACLRLNVNCQPWGHVHQNLTVGLSWTSQGASYLSYVAITGLTIGAVYILEWQEVLALSNSLITAGGLSRPYVKLYCPGTPQGHYAAATVASSPFTFTATSTSVYLWTTAATTGGISAILYEAAGSPLAYNRFNDPDGVDNCVLIVDAWRTSGDGGRGRAYRIKSGSTPQEIPLNGHDVWEDSRLVPCYNGLTLLRPGAERHYFIASDVNTGSDYITLHCTPAWGVGDLVRFNIADASSSLVGTAPPNVGATYYVGKNTAAAAGAAFTTGVVSLHTTLADAVANTGKLDWATAVGKFYLERAATQPGYFGNGAPPLLMQGSESQNGFEVGFKALATAVVVDSTNAVTTLTAPNHRFIPGDPILIASITGFTGSTTYYARPLSEHAFTAHASEDDALSNTSPIAAGATATGSAKKVGASGLALPPCHSGLYYKNRLLGLTGKNLIIGDPLDPLHCSPFLNTLPANQGESDAPVELAPISEDVVLICKQNSVLAVTGLAGPESGWQELAITREYGCIAPRSAIIVGKDVWMFGRRGIMSVTQTEQGIVRGVTDAVSRDMQKHINRVDWRYAHHACAATWNNRYFIALPAKGQSGTIKNNLVLVYNFLTGGWDGAWSGDALNVYAWARHTVADEERLTFVNYEGQVCFFGEGYTDLGQPIADELLTRIYTGGNAARKLWLKAKVIWETNNATLTVSAKTPGYNEEETLLDAWSPDPTKYLVDGQADYDPDTSTDATFAVADREDYSLTPGELLVGELGVHQNLTENLRLRQSDWGVQLRISNARGSCRVVGVEVQGVPKETLASRLT